MAKHPRLMKRGTVYWFRAKVPANLRDVYAPKREVVFSLRTKEYREAVKRTRVESLKIDQEFATAEASLRTQFKREITDTEIERLAALHYHMRLEEDDEFRAFGSGDQGLFLQIAEELGPAAMPHWNLAEITAEVGLSDREFLKASESTNMVLEAQRKCLARGDTGMVRDCVNELLEHNRIRLDPKSIEYRMMSLAILKADVRALEAIAGRSQGEVIDTPLLAKPSLTGLNLSATNDTPSLSVAFEEWSSQHNGPTKTVQTFKTAVSRFISLHGDKAVATITKGDIRSYRDAMLRFPSAVSNAERVVPVAALIESLEGRPDIKRLSPKTVNEKYLAAMSAILSLSVNEAGYIEINPCNGIRAKAQSSPTRGRSLYTDDDVATIMSFPIFSQAERPIGGAGEAAKWIPLLAMFTGGRLEELARLTVGDILNEAGIDYLFIRPGADGRRVKNQSSVRKVPIHSTVLRFGFLGYVAKVGSSAEMRLFPSLKSAGEQTSSAWSKWWGRYARSNGITDQLKVFHSFRHTVKRKLRDHKVEKTIRDALLGHAVDDVAETYGLDQDGIGVSLPVLAEAVERITYPCFSDVEAMLVG